MSEGTLPPLSFSLHDLKTVVRGPLLPLAAGPQKVLLLRGLSFAYHDHVSGLRQQAPLTSSLLERGEA